MTTNAGTCTSTKCKCNTGYSANTDNTACKATGALKGLCSANTDCIVTANAGTCTSLKCECDSGYTANADETACSSGNIIFLFSMITKRIADGRTKFP
ncbi:hypothetical protein DPMN_156035 [Dreissena polymorpha]|uniref:EB domain-containing protein n=1 Tax=Dreissena polymorpha TaxID=45954 RepID=A0A9D4FNA4_DREPO|nr:hypothetical protein DPMN_156035 [Dreissena polymorpha]